MSRHAIMLQQVQKLIAAGKPDQARSALARVLQKEPLEPWLNNAMAVTFVVQGRHQQAHYYAARAAKADPRNTEFQCTLGGILCAMGRHQEAVAGLEQAIAADPKAPNPRLAMANALAGLEQHTAAIHQCRVGLELASGDREMAIALTQALLNTGQVEESVRLAREVLPKGPQTPEVATWLPYALNYLSTTAPEESLAAHRAAASVMERTLAMPRPWAVTPDPDRVLRVGFVSPDLRTHSVAFFIEPILEFSDRSRAQLVCYSTTTRPDATSERLKSKSDTWRDVSGSTSQEIADLVRKDRIDILVDLAGLTGGDRLMVFVQRPAPVQITYLGYPNTTGLSSIQYRIVDSGTDPEDAQRWCTEKLLRLDPSFICYQPAPGTPEPSPLAPSASSGHPTFGSFNTLIKLSDATVALWSRVLSATDGSRLVLKCRQLADPGTREATIARFAAHGIDPSRIEVLPATKSLADHLATYARIDVGLDPTPYAGTTTTCEAMWMGVPVVTLAGDSHASRVGVSLLTSASLPDLITTDPDRFISTARAIALDHVRRTALRSSGPDGLRTRMAASPLCDAKGFASRFERLLRGAWRDWCANPGVASSTRA